MSSLEFRELSVSYDGRPALSSYSDTVRSGEWLGLIGPNGAGKSSMLRAVVGLVRHDGDVLVDGVALAARSARQRAELVAYVPQIPLMPDDMAAFEYVLLGRSPYVSYFGSPDRHDRDVGGQRARTARPGLVRRSAPRHAERRRAAAPRGRPCARPGGADPVARRTDERARHRPPAAGARARRPAAPRPRAHGRSRRCTTSRSPGCTATGWRCSTRAPSSPAVPPPTCCAPRLLAEFYGVRVTVHHEADGTVVVIPATRDLQ